MSKGNGDDFTISAAKAARRVGVTPRTIINKANEGRLPFRKKGRSSLPRYFFRWKDVESLRRDYN